MDIITHDTTLGDIKEFLSANGYECGEVEGNSLNFKNKGVKTTALMLPSGNITFMVHLQLKDDLDELETLKKINDINYKIISGNLSIQYESVTFCYTLIRPYGMGAKSFGNFVDYHTFAMSYMVEELGLSEITK